MVPYAYDGKTLLHVEQVIPLPEAEEYQVRVREKAFQERAARHEQGSRAERNLRFWAGLLPKANAVLPLHKNVSPSKDNWVAATAHGILYLYVTAHGKGRVELCIQRADKAENKAIYDDIHAHRAEIEAAFGRQMKWRRLDDGISSRISAGVEGGSVLDESSWESLQSGMVDGMQRFEVALRPFVDPYREGGSPAAASVGHVPHSG